MPNLISTMILAVSACTAIGALAAPSAPFDGADCVAFSNADMTGQTQIIPHSGDRYDHAVGMPAFTPKSLYLAKGTAARIYATVNFGGETQLIGGAADLAGDLANNHIHTTDGGHYLNLAEVWPGAAVAAFSCVEAGELVTLPAGSITRQVVVYNRYFSIDSFQNIHGNAYKITITSQNGVSQVKVASRQMDSGSGADAVLNLTTGDITVAQFVNDRPTGASTTAKRPPNLYTLDLAYAGAVKIMLHTIQESAYNNQGAEPQIGYTPESNPELIPVIDLLRDYDYSL